MPLEVWTARISSKDPDAFDVTRKTGCKTFAPSWAILGPALDRRRAGRETTAEEWKAYAVAYYDEMRQSRQAEPNAWAELLARPRVVLTCYCTRPSRCHRTLLARLLEKLGAKFEGEIAERDEGQQDLFKLAMGLED